MEQYKMMREIVRGRAVLWFCAVMFLAIPGNGQDETQDESGESRFQQLFDQCVKQYDAGKYKDLEETAAEMQQIAEGPLRNVPAKLAMVMKIRGLARLGQKQLQEAESFFKQSLEINEKALGENHEEVAADLDYLVEICKQQGRFAEGEALAKRTLRIKERVFGETHPKVGYELQILGQLYYLMARLPEAETMSKRALAIGEKSAPPEKTLVGGSLHLLADVYRDLGRFAESEAIFKRLLADVDRSSKENLLQSDLHCLAIVYIMQGRYAEAEQALQHALHVRRKLLGPDALEVAIALHTLAHVYQDEFRFTEAEALMKEALTICEKSVGETNVRALETARCLASIYVDQERYADAESLLKRSQEQLEKLYGKEDEQVCKCLSIAAKMYVKQERYTEAERIAKKLLRIDVNRLGSEHPAVAKNLAYLAKVYYKQRRYVEAEESVDRAIAIYDRTGASPDSRYVVYLLRARLAWKAGRKQEALADLRQATLLAEQQRAQTSGAEQERAASFAMFGEAFEQMVAWQTELGDVGEALASIERGRARSLLDDMAQAGVDIDVGRSALEREQARQRELALRQRVASLEKQIEAVAADKGKSKEEIAKSRDELAASLAKARGELYEHYRDERSSSPVYRNLLSMGAGPPRLSQIQRSLAGNDALILVYMLGDEAGYVVVIDGRKAELVKLAADQAAAKTLGIEAGPLTAKGFAPAMTNNKNTGLLQRLQSPTEAGKTTVELAALWRLLIPEPERKGLIAGKYKRLVVVPDGPLALLPFETLVVKPGKSAKYSKYLLDVGPAIVYAPSATVLCNLVERQNTVREGSREPVLTVGNPTYSSPATEVASADEGVLGQLSARSRYGAVGGRLAELPYTGWESNWVVEMFSKSNVKSLRLTGAQATEANVREQTPGRRIIHLACHGLADQSYGNHFGALALTPGSDPKNPADDGFLTLPEIYELNLKGCELAILSACETNYGPQQRGEGVWALSRGFLVAGSRRVVASNWLVDDEAAASLVSYFCSGIAQAEKDGKTPDYAQALHQAKCWVRQQEKWESPYYWGTFVLMGPN